MTQTDLDLCPTDHTGHSASRVAKRLGKLYGKVEERLLKAGLLYDTATEPTHIPPEQF